MCGIIFGTNIKTEIESALQLIGHRGKDYRGIKHVDNLSFGHNRLSIVDLNARSNQPFEDEEVIILFNGELYNYDNIQCQTELEFIKYLYKNVKDWKNFLEGQYVIVIYDKKTKKVDIARDWFGIIPLYFGTKGDSVMYSSERRVLEKLKYKKITEVPPHGIEHIRPTLDYVNINIINEMLKLSVAKRMIHSDIGMCLALSGGLDSIVLARLMKDVSSEFEAFTIVIDNMSEDAIYSSRFCKENGIKHTIITITKKELLKEMPNIMQCSDGVEMNEIKFRGLVRNYFVAKHAPKTVILCGEGADELFGGYPYFKGKYGLKMVTKSLGAVRSMRAINMDRVDRGGMWHTKEYRTPFLDYQLVTYVLSCIREPEKENLKTLAQAIGVPTYILTRQKYGKEEELLNEIWRKYATKNTKSKK